MIATQGLSVGEFVEVSGGRRGDQADEHFGDAVPRTMHLEWRDRTLRASTPYLKFLPERSLIVNKLIT
jgi:hypothetical protein